MNLSDPIADFLTRIRNACSVGHRTVDIPHSRIKVDIAQILKSEGYVHDVVVQGEIPKKIIRIHLKYDADSVSIIRGLQRISKPGLRQYVSGKKVPRVLGGLGVAVLSTPQGVITDRQARENRVGGEFLCEIW